MPVVHECLHEHYPQSASTESSFPASMNPLLILTTESISAGSATFSAAALVLQAVTEVAPVDSVSITSIHSYSSDQPVQDYAGSDRRSRSAAENIIPNTHEAGNWLPDLLPLLEGRVTTSALNVPIQRGSLLDLSLAFSDESITVEAVNDAIRNALSSAT